ncbi:unnamed protein product [Vitrella brassicaformis CCMP3155]|uniref:Transmembrane protein n=2 Tax=Vitrella brassicaformis TaxID=1169539 RepID=A0A0G4GB72_VITBC|nr:unnamed protein product [Vitrella brassicaformis CCMP3155]|eukprot:CEM26380.1 unnamed protein product [Vitrella brassicaformis CCMP3155]
MASIRKETERAVVQFGVNVIGFLFILCIYYNYVILQGYFYALFWAIILSIPLFSIKTTIMDVLALEHDTHQYGSSSSITYVQQRVVAPPPVQPVPMAQRQRERSRSPRHSQSQPEARPSLVSPGKRPNNGSGSGSWTMFIIWRILVLLFEPVWGLINGVESRRASDPYFGVLWRSVITLKAWQFIYFYRETVVVAGCTGVAMFVGMRFIRSSAVVTEIKSYIQSLLQSIRILLSWLPLNEILVVCVIVGSILGFMAIVGFFAFQLAQESVQLWELINRFFRSNIFESAFWQDNVITTVDWAYSNLDIGGEDLTVKKGYDQLAEWIKNTALQQLTAMGINIDMYSQYYLLFTQALTADYPHSVAQDGGGGPPQQPVGAAGAAGAAARQAPQIPHPHRHSHTNRTSSTPTIGAGHAPFIPFSPFHHHHQADRRPHGHGWMAPAPQAPQAAQPGDQPPRAAESAQVPSEPGRSGSQPECDDDSPEGCGEPPTADSKPSAGQQDNVSSRVAAGGGVRGGGGGGGPATTSISMSEFWGRFPTTLEFVSELRRGNITAITQIKKVWRELSDKLLEGTTSEVQEWVNSIQSYLHTMVSGVVGTGSYPMRFLTFAAMLLYQFCVSAFDMVFQALTFFTALYYLLTPRVSCLNYLEQLLSLVDPSQLIYGCIEGGFRAILVSSMKRCLFYSFYTWHIFCWFDVPIVFVPTAFAVLIALVPIIPPEVVTLPAVFYLWFHARRIAALALLSITGYVYWYVTTAIYAEIPDSNPWLVGLSVVLGIWALGLKGVIVGPLIASIPVILYNIVARYNANKRRETRAIKRRRVRRATRRIYHYRMAYAHPHPHQMHHPMYHPGGPYSHHLHMAMRSSTMHPAGARTGLRAASVDSTTGGSPRPPVPTTSTRREDGRPQSVGSSSDGLVLTGGVPLASAEATDDATTLSGQQSPEAAAAAATGGHTNAPFKLLVPRRPSKALRSANLGRLLATPPNQRATALSQSRPPRLMPAADHPSDRRGSGAFLRLRSSDACMSTPSNSPLRTGVTTGWVALESEGGHEPPGSGGAGGGGGPVSVRRRGGGVGGDSDGRRVGERAETIE